MSLNTEPAVRAAIKLSFVIWIVSQFPPELRLLGRGRKKNGRQHEGCFYHWCLVAFNKKNRGVATLFCSSQIYVSTFAPRCYSPMFSPGANLRGSRADVTPSWIYKSINSAKFLEILRILGLEAPLFAPVNRAALSLTDVNAREVLLRSARLLLRRNARLVMAFIEMLRDASSDELADRIASRENTVLKCSPEPTEESNSIKRRRASRCVHLLLYIFTSILHHAASTCCVTESFNVRPVISLSILV